MENKNIAENSFDAVHSLETEPLIWVMNKISLTLEKAGISRIQCGYIQSGIQADFKSEATGKEFILELRLK